MSPVHTCSKCPLERHRLKTSIPLPIAVAVCTTSYRNLFCLYLFAVDEGPFLITKTAILCPIFAEVVVFFF